MQRETLSLFLSVCLSIRLSVSVFRRSLSDTKQHRLNTDNVVHLILGLDSSDVSGCDQSVGDVSDTYGKKKQSVTCY